MGSIGGAGSISNFFEDGDDDDSDAMSRLQGPRHNLLFHKLLSLRDLIINTSYHHHTIPLPLPHSLAPSPLPH